MSEVWVATDKDGTITLHDSKPFKTTINIWWSGNENWQNINEEVCKMLIGKVLTWEDGCKKINIRK